VDDVFVTVGRLVSVLTGTDPFNVHAALARMEAAGDGMSEPPAAIEMALLDLKARALGIPVHSLLGGRVKNAVTLNAWIGTVPPAQAAREALVSLAHGCPSAEIKVS